MEKRISPEGYHRFYQAIERDEGKFDLVRERVCNKDASSVTWLMFDDFNKIFTENSNNLKL